MKSLLRKLGFTVLGMVAFAAILTIIGVCCWALEHVLKAVGHWILRVTPEVALVTLVYVVLIAFGVLFLWFAIKTCFDFGRGIVEFITFSVRFWRDAWKQIREHNRDSTE